MTAAAVAAVVACGDGVFEPTGPDPLVYVVLNETVDVDGETVQRAFLLWADSVRTPYRSAARFQIARESDGATFAWRDRGLEGESPFDPPSSSIAPLEAGNFELISPKGPRGDLTALVPQSTYRILIETQGSTVTGSATIPATFDVTLERRNGDRVLAWPPVPGAEGYIVSLPFDGLSLEQRARIRELLGLRRDTTIVLPDFIPAGTTVHVRALDRNLTQALEGQVFDEGSSGIEGGRGVFGALSEASLTL